MSTATRKRPAKRGKKSDDSQPSPAATASDSPTGRVKNPRDLVRVTIASGLRAGETVPVWYVDVRGIAVLVAGEVLHYAIGEYHGDEQAVRLIKMARDEGAVDSVNAWDDFLRQYFSD